MEQIFIQLLLLPLVTGICLLVAGVIMYFFPPKKINDLYSYRTRASMKSQGSWDFAQLYSTRKMIKTGSAMITIGLAGYFLPLSVKGKLMAGICITPTMIGYMLLATENAIKKQFKDF